MAVWGSRRRGSHKADFLRRGRNDVMQNWLCPHSASETFAKEESSTELSVQTVSLRGRRRQSMLEHDRDLTPDRRGDWRPQFSKWERIRRV